MRVDSRVEAASTTVRARNSTLSCVSLSMIVTPVARPSCQSTWRTTLLGRSVMLPVASAAGSVALTLEKYDRVMQPRWQGPQ